MRSLTALATAVLAIAGAHTARAENTDDPDWPDDGTILVAPIIPVDDTATQGPVETHQNVASLGYDFIDARARDDDAHVIGLQAIFGPYDLGHGQANRVVAPALDWMEKYSLRLRWSEVITQGGEHRAAPLTVSVQRYVVAEPFAIAPLIHLHAGVTATASTPWLGDRRAAPPAAMVALHAVDTELSNNGFSLRPGVYVRADAQLCRNEYIELGIEPEMFVSTIPDRPTEYLLRYRAAAGASLRCSNDPTTLLRPLTLAVEMRGRGLLYAGDLDPDHRAVEGLVLQYGFSHGIVVAARLSHAWFEDVASHYTSIGLTIQYGAEERTP